MPYFFQRKYSGSLAVRRAVSSEIDARKLQALHMKLCEVLELDTPNGLTRNVPAVFLSTHSMIKVHVFILSFHGELRKSCNITRSPVHKKVD